MSPVAPYAMLVGMLLCVLGAARPAAGVLLVVLGVGAINLASTSLTGTPLSQWLCSFTLGTITCFGVAAAAVGWWGAEERVIAACENLLQQLPWRRH